ncbi:unnamed protein product, partial [Closterium sp. NIES-54]
VDPRAGGAGSTMRPRPFFVPLLQQVLGVLSSTGIAPPLLCPPPDQSQPQLQPASLLAAPSSYTKQPSGLTSVSVCPPSVGGECALGTDVLKDRQEDFECLATAVLRFASMLLAPEGDPDEPDITTSRSYAEAITGEAAAAFSPAFKAHYIARVFSQRQGVDYFQTFSPTPKMTTLWVLLHVAAQRDFELHSLDFSTAFLQRSLHEEVWLCRPPGFTGSFLAGTQWSLRRPVYDLRQAPCEWHDILLRPPGSPQMTTLVALGFAPSTADPSLFLRTETLLPLFYILVYINDIVFATVDSEALTHVKSELQKRHTCTDLGKLHSYLGLQITRDTARRTITLTQSHMVHQVLQRFGFHFSSPQPNPLSTGHLLSAPPSDESIEPSAPPKTAETAPVPSAPGSPVTTPAAPPAPAAPVPPVRAPPGPAAPAAPAPAASPAAAAPAAPPVALAPAAPPVAPAPAAPPEAPAAPPAAPAAPPAAPQAAPPAAPAALPAAPAPPAAPVAPAPAAPHAAPAPVAPVARRQRRAYHSWSCHEERGSRRNGTPGEPPDSAPPDTAPPGFTHSGSAPQDSTPLGSAPPVPAPTSSAPQAAPESTAISTGSAGSI